ncbi:MAG: hypothetical protein U0L88_00995, partial [Acutalibacteraceae bacterium]|nr:hypothetical protein [Acutalibacteraceae bacterium]
SLQFRETLTNELDKALVQKSVTASFLDNSFGSKFVGTKTILIPDIDFVGLGDYDRAEGFPEGGITVEQKPYTLTQERARRFYVDRMDMDEIGIAGLSGQIMGEFVRTKVTPEVDAYNLSKLAGIASAANQVVGTGVALANKSVSLLSEAIQKVQNEVGFDEELVAICNTDFYGDLMSTSELTRRLDISDFKKGEISTKVRKLDECWIMPAPKGRMMTKYKFLDGVATAEKDGGFIPTEDAENIGFIVLPKRVAKFVKKLEKIRTFAPDTVQKKDAWQFDYRLYYDMLVKASEKGAIYSYIYK